MAAASSPTPIVERGEFVSFFLFQCERITLSNSKRRLKPTRSLLTYLASLEPYLFLFYDETQPNAAVQQFHDHAVDVRRESSDVGATSCVELELLAATAPRGVDNSGGVSLDLSSFYPGSHLCVALFRALEMFLPTTSKAVNVTTPGRFALRLTLLDVTQCGLDNDAVAALCCLLASGRCPMLATLILDRNEYVAVQAGQMLLRTLGVQGALGDGSSGKSHNEQFIGATTVSGGDQRALGSPEASQDAATTLDASHTLALPSRTLKEYLPQLCCISLVGTNCPPHFVRRVEALVKENCSAHHQHAPPS
jgi:hypothetical protein